MILIFFDNKMIIKSKYVRSMTQSSIVLGNHSVVNFIRVKELGNVLSNLSLWLNVYHSTVFGQFECSSLSNFSWQEYYIFHYSRFINISPEVFNN